MTKRGGMGKRKGSGFERKVCEQLSRWIAPDNDETLFWRSAMSGGRATNRFKQGIKSENQAGDITCIHPSGSWLTDAFAIECKFLRNLDIKGAFLNNKGKLAKFWGEICKVAEQHDKMPLLIAKENNTRTLLLMNYEGPEVFWYKSKLQRKPLLVWTHETYGHTEVFDFETVIGADHERSNNKRSSSRLKPTKRGSVEPVPVAKKASKKIRDKATLDIGGHHKRERPTQRSARQ